jgi:hypothetical protein
VAQIGHPILDHGPFCRIRVEYEYTSHC